MLLLPSLLCALAVCVSAVLAETSNLTDLYPPHWEKAPGQLSEYREENEKYIIDPWMYLQRLGMYKILITKTAERFERFAPNNEANILWGLALQHGWQLTSGRLGDPTFKTNCAKENRDPLCISEDSWWGCLNYYLSALPFLAAIEAGILGIPSDQVTLLPPTKDQMHFCYNVTTCRDSFPEAMRKWKIFYQEVKKSDKSLDDLLKYMWDAHKESLYAAGNSFDNRFTYLTKIETNFAKSWSIAVNYIAAINFPTTLKTTAYLQKALPPRMLNSSDAAPFIKDFTFFQNTILVLLDLLKKADDLSGNIPLSSKLQ